MTHFSEDPNSVRVDVWKASGKWYSTEAVKWIGDYTNGLIHDDFRKSLEAHFGDRCRGMTMTCLHPYHRHAHPISTIY